MATEQARFTALADSTAEDWAIVKGHWTPYLAGLADRVVAHLQLLADDHGGFPVSRLEHCLQTATRAVRAGRSEDYVVCALLHDIGDTLAPAAHADLAATILKPYVSEADHWMVAHHGVFQLYYHGQFWGLDRDAREVFRGHEHFERTAEFCELFDQSSFDPGYASLPLESFRPMLQRVLSVERLLERASA